MGYESIIAGEDKSEQTFLRLIRVNGREGAAIVEKATVKFRFDPETLTTLLWTRHTNDEMEVTILGTSILRTSDRGFRDAFDGAIIRNRLGDIAVWRRKTETGDRPSGPTWKSPKLKSTLASLLTDTAFISDANLTTNNRLRRRMTLMLPATGNLGDLTDRSLDQNKHALIDASDFDNPVTLSHGELDHRSNAVARALVARGYARGDRIAILAANSADYLVTYFGTMRAGMISVPVNWRFPPETVAYILDDCDAKIVFVDETRRDAVPEGLPIVQFGNDFESFLDPGPFDIVACDQDEVAMFLYTSGSTGRPKGVPLTHYGHLWVIEMRSKGGDIAPHRLLVAAPLYHMNALAIAKAALLGHATIVLLPQFTTEGYVKAVERFQCTWLTSVPTMMALITKETTLVAGTDVSSVKIVRMGSAPATQRLFDDIRKAFPGASISYGYGTTEAGPVCFGAHPDGLPTPDLSIGYPVPEVRMRLVDGDNLDADRGELQMDCPAKTPGYHKLPEKTAEVMTADGYYKTGDILRRDADGFHYFVDRVDDMFVCNGENVFPVEVEKLLESHPAIKQACVVPVDDEVRGAMPVAFVVAADGMALDTDTVKQHALAGGPAYQHPRHVWLLDDLPLASTNKLDRKTLAADATKRLAG